MHRVRKYAYMLTFMKIIINKQAIKWNVLSVTGTRVLLLKKYYLFLIYQLEFGLDAG